MKSDSPDAVGAGERSPYRSALGMWLAAGFLWCGLVGGTGCTGGGAPAGDDSPSTGADATSADVSEDCERMETSETCRERVGCVWLTVTCDTGGVVGGCFAGTAASEVELECSQGREADTRSSGGSDTCGSVGSASCGPHVDTGARDAGPSDGGTADRDTLEDAGTSADTTSGADATDTSTICDSYNSPQGCEGDSRCRWWRGTCDGEIVREKCIARGIPEPSLDCSTVAPAECHEFDKETTCPASSCKWVEEGCGGGTTNTLEVTDCLPDQSCTSDRDCPANHGCAALWIDPCATSSCTACGQTVDRCVPDKYLSP